MAVTSLWAINGRVSVLIDYAINPDKTSVDGASGLHKIGGVIQYAADELKTEKQEYVTCINCSGVETAAEDFLRTKKIWHKLGGRTQKNSRTRPPGGNAFTDTRVLSRERSMPKPHMRSAWSSQSAAGATAFKL